MERFFETEKDALQLRLVAALGAVTGLYFHQRELTLVFILAGSLGYLLYVNYSFLLRYYILPRYSAAFLAYGMITVDTAALTGILYVTKGLDSALIILFPVFILYYAISMGYAGSFFAATTATLGVAGYALISGPELAPVRIWVPLTVMFYIVAMFSGYVGRRLLRQEAEKGALQEQLGLEANHRQSKDLLEAGAGRILATVLFTDIVNSTQWATSLGDQRWRELLEHHHTVVRQELARFEGREVKALGDGFMAVFHRPAQAIYCACAISTAVRLLGIEIRAGIHTGETEVMEHDIGGLAVHIAARVISAAGPSEVLVSSTVKDLVTGSDIRFQDRGIHTPKGLPGEWRFFAVEQSPPNSPQ